MSKWSEAAYPNPRVAAKVLRDIARRQSARGLDGPSPFTRVRHVAHGT